MSFPTSLSATNCYEGAPLIGTVLIVTRAEGETNLVVQLAEGAMVTAVCRPPFPSADVRARDQILMARMKVVVPRERAAPPFVPYALRFDADCADGRLVKIPQSRPVVYKNLSEIRPNVVCSVFGVVTAYTGPARTKGVDHRLTFSIIDESVAEPLSVNFFFRDMKDLPALRRVGDIVRIHNMGVNEFGGHLQGTNFGTFRSGCSIVVLSDMPELDGNRRIVFPQTIPDVPPRVAVGWTPTDEARCAALATFERTVMQQPVVSAPAKWLCRLERLEAQKPADVVCEVRTCAADDDSVAHRQ